MRRFSKIMLPVIGALALVGCGDDAKETANNINEEASLQGFFQSDCRSSGLLDASERVELQFQGNQYSRFQKVYNSDDCSEDPGAELEYSGEFIVDKSGLDITDGGAITYEFQSLNLTVNSDWAAEALNTTGLCGLSDYKTGETVEISGEQLDLPCPLDKVPAERYGGYKLKGDDLMLDASSPSDLASSQSERAEEVNESVVYKKD